jgi:hypothetical protein
MNPIIFILLSLLIIFTFFRLRVNENLENILIEKNFSLNKNLQKQYSFENQITSWLKNNLTENYELVYVEKNSPLLTTIFWVAYKNKFKKNEFSNMIQPFIIQWRKNDDATIFLVDSIKPYNKIGTLPFIKNQNQEFANLFDIRLKYLLSN